MSVYRIHIRPTGGRANKRATFGYCLDNGFLGVGYRVDPSIVSRTKNWEEYYEIASRIHDDLRNCKYIHSWIQVGHLVWTRDLDAQYYLARVTSGWEYWTSKKGLEQDIDIANIFRCDLRKVNLDEVPGKIVACFRPGRAIQAIADHRAIVYSQYLWNKLSRKQEYDVDQSEYSDIFMMLDDEETEDLLFLFLQSEGWYVIPPSRKGDTMKFEFMVAHSESGEKAVTQVKTGDTALNLGDYSHVRNKVFLFQSNDNYEGAMCDNVICVPRKELQEFLERRIELFPRSFRTKLEIVQH